MSLDNDEHDTDIADVDGKLLARGDDVDRDIDLKAETTKPGWHSVTVFMVILAMLAFLRAMLGTYTVAVITNLEKYLGISSAKSGFLETSNDIGQAVITVFASYVGSKYHLPRFISVCTFLMALCAFLHALPYLIFGDPHEDYITSITADKSNSSFNYSSKTPTFRISDEGLCSFNDSMDKIAQCSKKASADYSWPFIVFLVVRILYGAVGSSITVLGITYLDDSSKGVDYAKRIGVVFGMFPFGGFTGFALGFVTTKFYVNPFRTVPFDARHPKFIGAWWIGYVVIAVLMILPAIPLYFFPRLLDKSAKPMVAKISADDNSVLVHLKRLPRAFGHLFSNGLFLLLCFSVILSRLGFSYAVFIPKYFEVHFEQTASTASIISGVSGAILAGVGMMLGGIITTKARLKIAGVVKFGICVGVATVGVLITKFLLECPDKFVVGINALNNTGCSELCGDGCSSTHFEPVCGDDGVSFLSPCYAGCASIQAEGHRITYSNCTCVNSPTQRASAKFCVESCDTFWIYIGISALGGLVGTLAVAPWNSIFMRIVPQEERALSLSFFVAAMMALSAIPGAILFGSLNDSACLFWKHSCGGRSRECGFYDKALLRQRMHGVSLGFKVANALIGVIVVILVIRRYGNMDLDELKEMKQEKARKRLTELEEIENENNYFVQAS